MSTDGRLWATADAAKCLGVSRQHVRRLVGTGQLSLFETLPGGQMLFEAAAVRKLQQRRGGVARWHARRPGITRAARELAPVLGVSARDAQTAIARDGVEALTAIACGKKAMAKAKGERLSIDTSPGRNVRERGRIA